MISKYVVIETYKWKILYYYTVYIYIVIVLKTTKKICMNARFVRRNAVYTYILYRKYILFAEHQQRR